MQEENKTIQDPSGDYISLTTVKKAFFDFFGFFYLAIELLSNSLKKNRLLFFLCCLLGIAAGFLYYSQRPRFYISEMTLHYNDLTGRDYYEIIDNLDNLAEAGSYEDLEKELQVEPAVAQSIQHLEVQKINGETLERDTSSKTGQLFKIHIRLNSRIETASLQQALIRYLNNSPYLRRIKEGQKRIYQEKLAFIDSEQLKLDSLKSAYTHVLASAKMPTTFYNNAVNPAELFVQSNNLANQKETAQKWLNNDSETIILTDSLKKPVPANVFSLKILLLLGLASGVVLGMLMCILAALTRKVQQHRQIMN